MATKKELKPVCGIVMPISELDGCTEEHWLCVREIIKDAINRQQKEAAAKRKAKEKITDVRAKLRQSFIKRLSFSQYDMVRE